MWVNATMIIECKAWGIRALIFSSGGSGSWAYMLTQCLLFYRYLLNSHFFFLASPALNYQSPMPVYMLGPCNLLTSLTNRKPWLNGGARVKLLKTQIPADLLDVNSEMIRFSHTKLGIYSDLDR